MVRTQLEARGIIDRRLLDAMRKVERHKFVDEDDVCGAYEDRPIPIGSGQTVSQPFMVALMTQTLDVSKDNKVLEIGTGSGYQTAILAELAEEVYTIERLEVLLKRSQRILDSLGYSNIHFHIGDGTLGYPEFAPFDRIMVTAAAPKIPEYLFQQLGVGGRLVIPVGGRISQDLCLITKKKGGLMQVLHRGGCVFVPLIGKDGWPED